jgi:hypothetical protein
VVGPDSRVSPASVLQTRCLIPVGAALALGVAAAPAAATPFRPAGAETPLGTERLSNEYTLTRWAHPRRVTAIRRNPAANSRRVGRLRMLTEDGYPEVYLALSSRLVPGTGCGSRCGSLRDRTVRRGGCAVPRSASFTSSTPRW